MRTTATVLTNMCMIVHGDEILVQDKLSPSYPGITFPGGHIEAGESLMDAMIREVREETGLTVEEPRLMGVYHWMQQDGSRYLVFLYRADRFTGVMRSSPEGPVFWLKKSEFLSQNLAQGMETVFSMMQDESPDECFYEPLTGEERLLPSTHRGNTP